MQQLSKSLITKWKLNLHDAGDLFIFLLIRFFPHLLNQNNIFVMSIFVNHDMRQSFTDKSLIIISNQRRYLDLYIIVIVHQYLKCIPKVERRTSHLDLWSAGAHRCIYIIVHALWYFHRIAINWCRQCILSPIPTNIKIHLDFA